MRVLLLTAMLGTLVSCAAAGPASRTCFHLDEKVGQEIGYCQAVRVGNTLHISGSVGRGKMPKAIEMAYGTLQRTLEAHGLGFRDVVSERVYATNLDAFIRHKDMRQRYYGDVFPAATWVQVQRLYLPSFVIEVELVAEFPQ